jgi:two-component system, NtrC family, response regulator GlrR
MTLGATAPVSGRPGRAIRRLRLTVVSGPVSGATWAGAAQRCAIGSHPSNDLRIDDETVSRFHCELAVDGAAVRVRDLSSRNGTRLGDVALIEAMLFSGNVLTLGATSLRIDIYPVELGVDESKPRQFGDLVGESAVMRDLFAQLDKLASSDATVLLQGETGTGKEGAAQAIHDASGRASGPFIVVDCGAIPPNLLEDELFGHEAGAFTGAVSRRIGAIEQASGGTLFLDEIGELPTDLQPKLLRALESREIRRVGSTGYVRCDLRIIAATNRDLRAEVNHGTFRADLYYRLAVVRITLPPLRERRDDIPLLVRTLVASIGTSPELAARLTAAEYLDALASVAWPGNVRELRNHLAQCIVFEECILPNALPPAHPAHEIDAGQPYELARRQALDAFERTYLEKLLERTDNNVASAARTAGVNRGYLYRLLHRHGLR